MLQEIKVLMVLLEERITDTIATFYFPIISVNCLTRPPTKVVV